MASNEAGPLQRSIEKKLREALSPVHMEAFNESYMHSVPKGSETHFKLVIVSPAFEGKLPLARHRLVNEILKEELEKGGKRGGIHALSLILKTPSQWEGSTKEIPRSPGCLGGSKHDRA